MSKSQSPTGFGSGLTLHDRIAAVLNEAITSTGIPLQPWYASCLADAVIAALEQYWRDGNPTPWARQVEITKWSGDE